MNSLHDTPKKLSPNGRSTIDQKTLLDVVGNDMYARGQRFLIKKLAREKNKKDELDKEEQQDAPELNKKSIHMMGGRKTPSWTSNNSPRSSSHESPRLYQQKKDPVYSDVMAACFSATQAVERILSGSPSQSDVVSNYCFEPSVQETPPQSKSSSRSRSASVRTTASVESKLRSRSTNRLSLTSVQPLSKTRKSATHQNKSQITVSPATVKSKRGSHSSVVHPPTLSSAKEQSALQLTVSAQHKQISELQDHVAYLTLLLGIDSNLLINSVAAVRNSFRNKESLVWARILSFLSLKGGMALRMVPGAPQKAADLAYSNWFHNKEIFKVRSHGWRRFYLPCASSSIITEGVECQYADSGVKIFNKSLITSGPCPLNLKGNGFVKFQTRVAEDKKATPTSTTGLELPQGVLKIISVDNNIIKAEFTHDEWLPFLGDTMVLVKSGSNIPPLCPTLSSEYGIVTHVDNVDKLNPWSLSLSIPDNIPSGDYELRYLESLCKQLACSSSFRL